MSLRWMTGVVAAIFAVAVAAQVPAEGGDQKRRLIEQKIRLVEALLNSPAARGAAEGSDADPRSLIEQGKQAIGEARKALAEARFDEAAKLADDALRSVSSASRRMSPGEGGLPESAQRKNLQDLGDQVGMYRNSVEELAKDSQRAAPARALLGRIDALTAESRQLADAGRIGEAGKKMAEAYKVAVEELSRLRAGQEVLLSLKFDTPADEYAYEKKRFASNEIMVDMMLAEGRAAGDKRRMVDGFVEEGHKLGEQADEQAKAGRHAEAVKLMEQASAQLIRALQSMGVPVF
ncbi:hypothetical protein U5817_01400 [Aromatoleum evansii]|uniref:Uncharacterized protein n=1 Tax=Aromatoleum evansii TaxID=59406 RepID=A0ABZ1ALI8_AROEV|nr:hypothetical protein U5817_01400 [Aromatoleum evansii]